MIRVTHPLCTSVACVAMAGCAASASPQWDSTFGDSVRELAAQQLIDPAAPARNGKTVPPVDGRTVREANGRYVDTFRTPPPPSVITIGVGGGTVAPAGGQ